MDNERIAKQKEHISNIKSTLQNHGYEYIEPIGQGGYSSVHLVNSVKYLKNFVVKVSVRNGEGGEVSHAEITSLLNLIHPNIISMYEFFFDRSFLYIILEYCPGGSLADRIKNDGPLKQNEFFRIVTAIVKGLACCHEQQIAHRDIKPANILLDDFDRPKLADFGLSNKLDYHCDTFKSFGGTLIYMAPELVLKSPHDPFKTDIWALGVTFYQLATGEIPWVVKSVKDMKNSITMGLVQYSNPLLPKSFVPLLKAMLNVKPEQRCDADWLLKNLPVGNCIGQISSQKTMGSMLNLLSQRSGNKKLTPYMSVNTGVGNSKNEFLKNNGLINHSNNNGALMKCGSVLSFQQIKLTSRCPGIVAPHVKMTFS